MHRRLYPGRLFVLLLVGCLFTVLHGVTSVRAAAPDPTVTATSHGVAAPADTPLGGLNLDAYCQSHGAYWSGIRYGAWFCFDTTFRIDLDDACRWTYGGRAYAHQDRRGDLGSYTCYQPVPVALGGLNLDAYCQGHYASWSGVRYGVWYCFDATYVIDLNDACAWTYGPGVVARQDRRGDPYSYTCYG